jgi:hypothetical protein
VREAWLHLERGDSIKKGANKDPGGRVRAYFQLQLGPELRSATDIPSSDVSAPCLFRREGVLATVAHKQMVMRDDDAEARRETELKGSSTKARPLSPAAAVSASSPVGCTYKPSSDHTSCY